MDSDDEEEEVFFGPVTEKEQRKASKHSKRKTAVFKPGFRQDAKLMRYTMDKYVVVVLIVVVVVVVVVY